MYAADELTIGMCMCNEYSIYLPQPMFREPLYSGRLEAFPDIDDDRAIRACRGQYHRHNSTRGSKGRIVGRDACSRVQSVCRQTWQTARHGRMWHGASSASANTPGRTPACTFSCAMRTSRDGRLVPRTYMRGTSWRDFCQVGRRGARPGSAVFSSYLLEAFRAGARARRPTVWRCFRSQHETERGRRCRVRKAPSAGKSPARFRTSRHRS